MESITPNLIVDSIESCLPFYVDRLSFEITVSVPDGDTHGFVILKRGDATLMLQSRASVAGDIPGLERDAYRTSLYVKVPTLGPIREALRGWPEVIPERTTFYGAREIIVRDPAGNILAFAEQETTPAS